MAQHEALSHSGSGLHVMQEMAQLAFSWKRMSVGEKDKLQQRDRMGTNVLVKPALLGV